MIAIFSGLPGSGKSLKLADTLIAVMKRNKKWYDKQYKLYEQGISEGLVLDKPIPRLLYTNLKFGKEVEDYFEGWFSYWSDLRELVILKDVDVAIDEVATYFDARQWENLSLEMRRWLAQHRKFGIEIYGTTQDFAQVDKAFRRLTSDLLLLNKIIGSRDVSPTRPAPKWVFGLILVRTLDPTVYDELKSKFTPIGIPRFMFITRDRVDVFDTRAEVKMSAALAKHHIEHVCERPNCAFHKIVHV